MSQPFSHAPDPPRPPPAPNLQGNPTSLYPADFTATGDDDDAMLEGPNFADSQKQLILTLAQMLHCAESISSLRTSADPALLSIFDTSIRDMYRVLDNTYRVFKGNTPYLYKDSNTAPTLSNMGEELFQIIGLIRQVPKLDLGPTPSSLPQPAHQPAPTPRRSIIL